MAKKKKKRVPEILYKIYGQRARTLGETVISLVGKCCCKRRRCLSCNPDQATSRLLRPHDSSEYKRLLNKCFVVVSENAPPVPPFNPHRRWHQREFVTRSIEMIISEQPSSQNLICNSYDRKSRTSDVVDMLTSSEWALLLRRVGDSLMLYLLKYTSIFLALPRNNFQQIAGFPISDFGHNFLRHISDSKTEQQQIADHGLTKKRKSFEVIESTSVKRLYVGSQASMYSSNICTNGSCSVITKEISLKNADECSNQDIICTNGSGFVLTEEISQENADESSNQDNICTYGSGFVITEEISQENADESSNHDTISSRKHRRRYQWQRQRKRSQLIIQETTPAIIYSETCCSSGNLSIGLRDGLNVDSGQSNETGFGSGFWQNVSDYPCRAGFENIRRISRNSEIDRRKIFYRLETSASMFPRNHILYVLKPYKSGALFLFKNVFRTSDGDYYLLSDPCLHRKCTCDVKSTCLFRSIIKLLKSLISNTQNCPYMKLLDKHCSSTSSRGVVANEASCPVFEGNMSDTKSCLSGHVRAPSEVKSLNAVNPKNIKMKQESTVVQADLCKSWCPKKQVVSFVWAICRRIVPSPLLGAPSNWRTLRKSISKFIHLRKFEKFSLKDCMHKLKLSQFPLLSNNRCTCSEPGISDIVRHAILDHWIFWFFTYLVSPLIRANFYVTESENAKQEVLYYRKSTWEKMMTEAQKFLDAQSYRQLNHASLRRILRDRSFGFSRARLRPKHFGFRVLANLQVPSKLCLNPPRSSRIRSHPQSRTQVDRRDVKYKKFKSVNSMLRDLHVVLKGLRRSEPEKLGSSVFDYNDVYRKLVPFLFLLRNGSATMPNVFIVVSDVSKAFDSVDQRKLLSVMNDVLLDNEYTLEKLVQIIRTKRTLKYHEQHALACRDIVFESQDFRLQHAHALDSIVVKKEISRIIKGDEFDIILKEHIAGNVVKIHDSFYLQQVGIPQGSILSTLLCSYYYGHMERNIVFPFLEKACENTLGQNDEEMLSLDSKSLLLRFVDDYFFISTSKKQASMFFSRLKRGFREYNCCMNKDKYGLNFNMNHGEGCLSDKFYSGKDGVSFLRWSGLLINCCTLEIQADYTRYVNSHLRSTVTVRRQGKVGRHLKEKLCDYLRPKCHPLFYDSNINSPGVVRLNIYQVFLLCAMKFICYISYLSTITKFSPNYYFGIIVAALRHMNRLVKRRMYSRLSGITFRPKYDVQRNEIIWLGLYAFTQVIKKKQSRHKELLRLFTSKLKAHEKVMNISSNLEYAITASRSSALWAVKY